jgi:hypothetical protein
MRYETPQIVVLGTASVLVQGGQPGKLDNGDSRTSKPIAGIVLGLD